MTAIGGHVAATRKPGVLGIHSVGEFVLRVPDLEPAQDFYGAFGLDVWEEGDGLSLRTRDDGYRWGRVTEGPRKTMSHITLHCFEEDLPRFRKHLEEQRVPLTDAPSGFESNGLWFRDMDGMPVEITVGPKTTPDEKTAPDVPPTPAGIRNAPYRSLAERRAPRRLSHILRFTPDVIAATAFYSRVLGLRLSDRTGDIIAFLHGVHGSDHHLVAFVKSPGPGLHHLSWDVPSIEAIGLGAIAMAGKGFSEGWGFGRHVLGSNYFHYVRDPWGSYSEFSCDIDHVPASMDWEGMDHKPEDGFYLWGPEPPPEFVVNHEITA
jgi:catechol 2,3-dioxygenase-like lactoylglutathione lyase family enzyme